MRAFNRMKIICDTETKNNVLKTPQELLVDIKKKYILKEFVRNWEFWNTLFITNLNLFQCLNDRLKRQS